MPTRDVLIQVVDCEQPPSPGVLVHEKVVSFYRKIVRTSRWGRYRCRRRGRRSWRDWSPARAADWHESESAHVIKI